MFKPKPKKIPDTHYRVEVVEYETGDVVKTLDGGTSERRADRIDSGLNHNLDHERFYTRIMGPGE